MSGEAWRIELQTAIRRLRTDVRTTGMVIATLALGIGLNLAAFALLDAVVLRPLPFRDWPELRAIGSEQVYPLAVINGLEQQLPGARSLAGVSIPRAATAEVQGKRLRVESVQVTGAFFTTLGVAPLAGRLLGATDTRAGAPPTVVLAEPMARQLAATPAAAVGTRITLDGIERQVVGVIDPRAAYPATGAVWAPAVARPEDGSNYWGDWRYSAIARIPTAVPDEATTVALRARLREIRTGFPWFMPEAWGQTDTVGALSDRVVGSSRVVAAIVLVAVALVLIVTILNVAQLLAGRQLARQREVAIRAALGASPLHLARLALLEGLLLTGVGLLVALALGAVAVRLIPELFGAALPAGTQLTLGGWTLVYGCGLALLTGALVSVLPARMAMRTTLTVVLTDGGRGASAGATHKRTARLLVGTQLAFSGALITIALAAALAVFRLRTVDAGFSSDGVVVGEVPLPAYAADSSVRGRAFFTSLPGVVSALPGVKRAAVASVVPLDGALSLGPIAVSANPTPQGSEPPSVSFAFVSDGYFSVLGMRVLEGRALAASDMDTAAKVVVVNRAAAEKLWPGQQALGERVRYVWRAGDYTVVGIVNDVRADSLSGPAVPTLYFPITLQDQEAVKLLVQTPLGLAAGDAIRSAIEARAAGTTLGKLEPLAALRDRSMARSSVVGIALGLFGAVTLVLGAIGMYAAADRLVRARTREFGIRMALGATSAMIARAILIEGAQLAALGAAAGSLLAVVSQRVLLHFAVPGGAPIPLPLLVAVFAILISVTLLASLRPARVAAATDPLVALRAS
jgi:putative ABC transport system permease protein